MPIIASLNGISDRGWIDYSRGIEQAGSSLNVDRYAVVIPPGTQGPIAVSAAVYYQSVEAIVAGKFLGNMADTNSNFVIEPCVLGGLCDRHDVLVLGQAGVYR